MLQTVMQLSLTSRTTSYSTSFQRAHREVPQLRVVLGESRPEAAEREGRPHQHG